MNIFIRYFLQKRHTYFMLGQRVLWFHAHVRASAFPFLSHEQHDPSKYLHTTVKYFTGRKVGEVWYIVTRNIYILHNCARPHLRKLCNIEKDHIDIDQTMGPTSLQ